jgi:hypothetical protein
MIQGVAVLSTTPGGGVAEFSGKATTLYLTHTHTHAHAHTQQALPWQPLTS